MSLFPVEKLEHSPEVTKEIIRGHILATLDSIILGSGVSLLHQTFIFGVESYSENGDLKITPVEISYSFTRSEGPLPESFFDHSKLYEFRVHRTPNGDTDLKSIAYIDNITLKGDSLQPTLILKLLNGAPKDVLKMDMILPLYMLSSDGYKIIPNANDNANEDTPESRNGN
jgi:hypothetical protein